MKAVEELNPVEVFDHLTLAILYGMAMRGVLRTNPRALDAARTLIAELRQDNVLREKMEQ